MMKNIFLTLLLTFLISVNITAQNTSFKTKTFSTTKVKQVKTDLSKFNVSIIHLEKPSPDGDSYKSFLMNQKILSKKMFPKQTRIQNRKNSINLGISGVKILDSYGMIQISNSNDTLPIYGGLPNDNTMAISNDGLLLLSINSKVQLIDTKNDSLMYSNEFLNLQSIFGLSFGNYFDPKIIYDKDADRFILVFLKNNNPASSKIIVGFSKTNNPIDGWNVYELPGNPLNNNRWTDFPTVSLSESHLYFTGNLIVPNVSWQIGFDGSVIWKMDKNLAYNDASDIKPILYYDIKFDEKYIRNIHAVQGADGNANAVHFLSNRNFDLQNDTIFMVSFNNENDTSLVYTKALLTNISYGVPPNGIQEDTDLNDPTEGLQTNDARVLAAIQFEDEIQFVSNTVNPSTGLSAIFHGTINLTEPEAIITAKIISDPVKDYAYPNIAWTGKANCDKEVVISFNHTSAVDYAGISAIHRNNAEQYSSVFELKKGENIVDRLPAGYERWGDYFGMQRKYNEPGIVYTFGLTTDITKRNFGWVNKLQSTHEDSLSFSYKIIKGEDYCTKQIKLNISGGVAPYSVEWTNSVSNNTLISDFICNGDSVDFTILDAKNCSISSSLKIELTDLQQDFSLFPNPTNDLLAFQFRAVKTGVLDIEIYNIKGSFEKLIAKQQVKKGLNEIYFSTESLSKGTYYLLILNDESKTVFKEKFIKK